jgi:hypothetical protein
MRATIRRSIMQRRGSEYWWWYEASAASVAKLASQNGARIVDLESYIKNGSKRFAFLLLNDLNAESTRLREIMRTGLSGGSYGVYVKKVGSSAPVGLQQNTIFEPASSMKVVHHLYTMQRIMNGADSLSASFNYWVKPFDTTNKDVYPDPAWESVLGQPWRVTTTVQDGLTRMMQNSDNRTTRGFQLRWGHPTLNAFADSLGMTNTELRQIIGCGFNNGLRNDLTLVDAGKLYESVVNGSSLTGSSRTTFWNILLGGRFVDDLTIPCQVKGASESTAAAEARCSKYKKANAALNTVGTEMFRSIIRTALKTW